MAFFFGTNVRGFRGAFMNHSLHKGPSPTVCRLFWRLQPPVGGSYNLVGGLVYQPIWNNMHFVKLDSFLQVFRWKRKNSWEPPPRKHGRIAKTKKTRPPFTSSLVCKQTQMMYNLGFVSEWLTLGNAMKFFKEQKQPSKSLKSRFKVLLESSGIWEKTLRMKSPPVFFNNELNAQKLSVVVRYGDMSPTSGGNWGNLPFKDKKSRFTPFSLGKVAEALGDKSKNTYSPEV